MTVDSRRPLPVVVLLSAAALVAAARPAAAQQLDNFAALLTDAGVNLDDLASVAESGRELTSEQLAVVGQVHFRLDQLEPGQVGGISTDAAVALGELSGDAALPAVGSLVRIDGAAVTQSELRVTTEDDAASLWRINVELSNGNVPITLISAQSPRAWLDRDSLHESVQAIGVYAGAEESEGNPRPVVLVNRLRWYPTTGVPSGVAWLAANGFDAALLDDVRPVSAFGKPHESRESEAFYACLAAVRRGDAAELRRLAREEVREAVPRWREKASRAPDDGESPSREARIAAAVERTAERGVSSVGPMYLAPADTMGRLVLIEGVARRAVRIVVDDETDAGDLKTYYELDLFTADSENLPVICCAVSLPAGFPTGDRINEPLRVAGVFFKRWAYLGRPDADDGESAERIAAPLVLAVEPQWLRDAGNAPSSRRGMWIGLAFVGALALVWLVAALAARGDRLARSRRTSYDAEPGVGLGSRSADE